VRKESPFITLLDSESGEVLVYAPLSKTRVNALIKAYGKAGITASVA
jgi:hypothetical protein